MVQSIGTLAFVAVLLGTGCAHQGTASVAEGQAEQKGISLYDRLGKTEAITAVVDDFVTRVAADRRINATFASTNIPRLKARLVEQLCSATGGPCTYRGRDMKTVHAGMGITEEQFDALVGDLIATLEKFQVPQQEQKELLNLLGPMKADIVAQM